MFKHIAAVERVQYQPQSRLATRLVVLCQKMITQGDVLAEKFSGKELRSKLAAYMEKEFIPEIKKISMEELNLTIYDVALMVGTTYLNAFMWPVFHNKDWDWEGTASTLEIFSGTMAAEKYEKYKKDIVQIFVDPVDLEASKLKAPNKSYKIGLGVYVQTFATKHLFSGVEPITAEEIAAVICHEIGHGMTIIEHAADAYYRADAFKDSIVRLSEKKTGASDEDVEQLVKVADAASTDGLPKESKSVLDQIVAACRTKAVQGFIDTIVILVAAYCGFFVAIYMFMFLNSLIGGLFEHAGNQLRGGSLKQKTSDRLTTDTNDSYVERLADEFVSRHGLGSAIASAFLKSAKYEDHGYAKGTLAHYMSQFALGQVVVNSLLIVHDILTGGVFTVSNLNYDQEDDRLEKLVTNNYAIFKDLELPKEARDQFIADTDRAIKVLNELRSERGKSRRFKFWATIERLYRQHNPIGALFAGNLAADYDELQRLTDGFIRNPLYYAAGRIQQVIDKKKD